MKRIDRLFDEARMLRVKRASRAQGLTAFDADADWFAECGTAQILLNDLSEDELPADADRRRTAAISVYDVGVLAPFIAAAREAISKVYADLAPQKAVFDDLWPKAFAFFESPKVADPDDDALRFRRSAAMDVAVLAAESVLFEAVRQVILGNDLARVVSTRTDPGGIVVEGGRVRRSKRPRAVANAGRRVAAAIGGRPVPEAVMVSSGRLGPIEERAERELPPEERRRRRAERKRLAAAVASAVGTGPAGGKAPAAGGSPGGVPADLERAAAGATGPEAVPGSEAVVEASA